MSASHVTVYKRGGNIIINTPKGETVLPSASYAARVAHDLEALAAELMPEDNLADLFYQTLEAIKDVESVEGRGAGFEDLSVRGFPKSTAHRRVDHLWGLLLVQRVPSQHQSIRVTTLGDDAIARWKKRREAEAALSSEGSAS